MARIDRIAAVNIGRELCPELNDEEIGRRIDDGEARGILRTLPSADMHPLAVRFEAKEIFPDYYDSQIKALFKPTPSQPTTSRSKGGRPSERAKIRAACRKLGRLPAQFDSNKVFLNMFRQVKGVPSSSEKGWGDDTVLRALRDWNFDLADDDA